MIAKAAIDVLQSLFCFHVLETSCGAITLEQFANKHYKALR
jgi:hypothetical protein